MSKQNHTPFIMAVDKLVCSVGYPDKCLALTRVKAGCALILTRFGIQVQGTGQEHSQGIMMLPIHTADKKDQYIKRPALF